MMASHRWEAACCSTRIDLLVVIPQQVLVNAVDGVVGDLRQHMAQPSLGGDPVQLGGADQRGSRGGPFAAAVGAGEQVVAAADGDAAQRPFGRRVVDFDGAVVAVAQQRGPQIQCVLDGRRRVGIQSCGHTALMLDDHAPVTIFRPRKL